MEVGYGSDVPRTARNGTRAESMSVVNEVGNNHSHDILRKLDGLGRTRDGRRCHFNRATLVTSPRNGGQLLYFDPVSVPGLVPVPELVSERCDICSNVEMIQLLISEATNGLLVHLLAGTRVSSSWMWSGIA